MTKTKSEERAEVALIVGGGPGVSASCARLFSDAGIRVAIAARNPEKEILQKLAGQYGVQCYACDARDPGSVKKLFDSVRTDLGAPNLVVHNIDGRTAEIFRKEITEADPERVRETLQNSAFSAFLVGQQAAQSMLAGDPPSTAR
jgi:NAD(P)-dependent dehydrogenase (short-subunit alcohol dehydrogenase family)